MILNISHATSRVDDTQLLKPLEDGGADNSDEEIARILEIKDSRNTEELISRLTYYRSVCSIEYVAKILN